MNQEPLYTTRRDFLGGGLTFLSAATTLPLFLGRTARALAQAGRDVSRAGDEHPILVVVQLAGGNDGLNTVIPYGHDLYYRYRPRLAVRQDDVLRLEDGLGLHPAATGLKSLFDEGRLAIVQGVGYPNPNRSHFASMDIWHTADPGARQRTGWLGRYFDSACAGQDRAPRPIEGVALMDEAPLALRGGAFMPLAFESPDRLRWRGGGDEAALAAVRKLNALSVQPPADAEPEPVEYLRRAALQAQLGADQIRAAAGRRLSRGRSADGPLGRQLQLVGQMIRADLPTRVYYVSLGGFDTHRGQAGTHERLLRQLGAAIKAFVDGLAEDGLLDRVLIMTFSEFGRRVQENASGGTDHGAAAPMFLIGSKVRPGVHERHPDLARLHRGDLAYGCDFRGVYAAVLRDWLKTNPRDVLGRTLAPVNVVV